ncbi:cation:proton antiporter [Methylomicrobium agile]|uniref:cation:proton antiporter n=1 Tax=Methylomicrobium agile TaxID=39774 RepID=UPI0004DEEF12|nr:cation:proton antiporter [Methylomicrobium agile]
MNHETEVFFGLLVVFAAAQIGAEVAQRLRLPALVGEIAAGCVIGPSVLDWVHVTEPLEMLSGLGAVLLLFSVGLENRIGDLRKVGGSATLVGVLGVIVPFVLGSAWAKWSGFDTPKALFIAAAFVATSAGVTARVLQELGVLDRTFSRIILGAAVIDDILAMLLLGVVSAIQSGGAVDVTHLLIVLGQAIAFIILIAWAGTHIMRRSSPILDAPINPFSALTLSLALCLALADAASYLGLAAIIGAFLAGLIAAETRQRETLSLQLQPILAFLVPFFFVVTGAQVDLAGLSELSTLGALAGITLLAVVGKLLGCGLGAWSLGRKSALIVGVGMVPRGDVGIIVASLGQHAGIINNETYTLLIAMVLLTTVVAPPLLSLILSREAA